MKNKLFKQTLWMLIMVCAVSIIINTTAFSQTAQDSYTARVSAIDIADGEELEGATIQIIDSEGNVVEAWVSTKESHMVNELNAEEEYTLRTTVAPEGYIVPTDTTFTITSNGNITTSGSTTIDENDNTVLLIEFAKTHVEVLAVKLSDGYELEGVTIQICDSEGNVVEEWESTTEIHEIEGLKTGEEYSIVVTVVPTDYAIPVQDTFIIDEEGKYTSTGSVDEDGVILVEIAEDVTPVTYEVTLNPNGGSVTPTSIQVNEDGTYGELPVPEPAEEGINFLGWFKSRVPYDDNACFNDTTITNYVVRVTPAGDMNHHNSGVHYFNYGDILVFNVTIPDATILKVDLNDTYVPTTCYTISEDGHNVKGVVEITNKYNIWYVLDFIDIEITRDVDPYNYHGYTINEFSIYKTPVTAQTDVENANHSLIAAWDTLLPVKYTLTIDLNGGTAGPEFQESAQFDANTEGPILEVPESFAIPPEGCEFDALEINGVRYEVGSTYTLVEDADIKILWKVVGGTAVANCTITFDSNEGTGTMDQIGVAGGSEYTLPACTFTAPKGKKFAKWEVNGENYEVGAILTLTENTVIKAIWKTKSSSLVSSSTPSSYKVTTKIENGTITPSTATLKRNESEKFKFKANEGYEIKDVLVDGKSIGAVNSYTIEKITGNCTIEVKTAKRDKEDTIDDNNGLDTDTEEIMNNFTDVSKNSSFYSDVEYAIKNNLFRGVSKTEFGPNIKLTRGMLVAVLYKFADGKEIETSDFDDVDKNEYYSVPIAWATKNGIVSGIGDNKFNPDANVTKQDLATIIYKYMQLKGKGFKGTWMFLLDADDRAEIEEYAYEPVCWLVMNNVLKTDKNNKINPTAEVTRIETVQVFRKIAELLK